MTYLLPVRNRASGSVAARNAQLCGASVATAAVSPPWAITPFLVKRLESEEKTAGGRYSPDTAKEKPSKGQVVAVGPGKMDENGKRIPMAVKPGDEVLFNKYAGTEVKLDNVDHLVMREEDILAIID